MFKQKISISINGEVDLERVFHEFEALLACYTKTGQIIGDYETPYVAESELVVYQTTLEEDSLASQYNTEYVTNYINNLEAWCNAQLVTEVVSTQIPRALKSCTCTSRTHLVLFTTLFHDSSPVLCGNCDAPVPLYKLTGLTHSNRHDIISWEKDYKSCDMLQIHCRVGEKWAMKQMADPHSQLSLLGMEQCKQIQGATGLPVYYYLFNYRRISIEKDKARKCPSCKQNWLLPTSLHEFYDFQCKTCLLISSLTSNATYSPVNNQ